MSTHPRVHVPTALALAGTLVVLVAWGSLWIRGRGVDVQYGLFIFHNGPTALMFGWLSRLVVRRQPGNRIGWLLLIIGLLAAAHVAAAAITDLALVHWGHTSALTWDHGLVSAEMPLSASIPFFVMNWLWVPQVVLLVGVLPLIFPDGRLPGPRWRIGPFLTALAGLLLMIATMADGWPTSTWTVAEGPPIWIGILFAAGGLVMLAAVVVALAGMGVHWRATPPDRRGPFNVVGVSVAGLAVVALATYPWQWLWIPAVLVGAYLVMVSYGLAAARFRIHELEPVLARVAVANLLSVVAALGFVVAVVVAAIAVSRATGSDLVPYVAIAAAALGAEPIRRSIRWLIDRTVFRLAADRTEVVSAVAAEANRREAPSDLLSEVVDALRRGTGADRVEARLVQGAREELVAAVGRDAAYAEVLAEPITSHGERLGELRLLVDLRGDLAPGSAEILSDVARVTGAAVHNSRLSSAVSDQLAELRESRRRLVEAQDTARRRVERDLHDGAQAQLIALRLRLAVLTASLNADGPPELEEALGELGRGLEDAVETLRDLARGLHPPVLDDAGVSAALRSAARGLPLKVAVVESAGFGRYEASVESAIYFGCLEAVQNAVRHAHAERVSILLEDHGSGLSFTVADDGRGFDPDSMTSGAGLLNIADRLGALGGDLTIEAAPGQGTRVLGALPALVEQGD